MSWYHDFDGGRAWYTNMGHTEATYTEPLFLQHLLGGLRYAIGTGTVDFNRARPEENRFTRVVLAEKLDEPIELAVLPDERVLFIGPPRPPERRGGQGVRTHAPFFALDSTAAWMNLTPCAPSSTVGTSSAPRSGARFARRARICSARSRYRLANASR